MDLSEFAQTEYEGTITEATVKPLREYLKTKRSPLPDKVIDAKFNNPDRENIIVVAECEDVAVSGFFMIPKRQGWNKSNLKRFVDRNSLSLDTEKWPGKKIKLNVDKGGFLRFAL